MAAIYSLLAYRYTCRALAQRLICVTRQNRTDRWQFYPHPKADAAVDRVYDNIGRKRVIWETSMGK